MTVFVASTVHNTNKNLITDNKSYISDDSEGVPFVYIKARDYRGNGIKRVLNMLSYYRGAIFCNQKF